MTMHSAPFEGMSGSRCTRHVFGSSKTVCASLRVVLDLFSIGICLTDIVRMAAMRTAPKSAILALRPVSIRAPHRPPLHRATAIKLDYDTTAFEKELVDFAGAPEYIVKGGRDRFANLPQAFRGIKEARSHTMFIMA
jgi:hypothetical protein